MSSLVLSTLEESKVTNATGLTDNEKANIASSASSQDNIKNVIINEETNEQSTENDAVSIKKNSKKKRFVFDSDSEEEDDFISKLIKKKDSEYEEDGRHNLESANGVPIRSNEDFSNSNEDLVEAAVEKPRKPRFQTLIDSESEDDSRSIRQEDSESSDNEVETHKKKKSRSNVVLSSDDEEESEDLTRSSNSKNKKVASSRKKKEKPEKKVIKSKISSLVDTDSEDESKEGGNVDEDPSFERVHKSGKHEKQTEKSGPKRSGSHRASKDEAMRQIHSETQRLIRSSEVSLPYHRPKQRSLQEFLNRKQHTLNLPEGLSIAAKVKRSIEIVGKVLEKKEKEAELFYKSSDSEDEAPVKSTPANPENKNEASSVPDEFDIECTQRHCKNDVQNAHNKKEIIQHSNDIGVSRKLFGAEMENGIENEAATAEDRNEEVPDCEDHKRKAKEVKHGLREVSVPRKLFSNDYEEMTTPTNDQHNTNATSELGKIIEPVSETPDSSKRDNDNSIETDQSCTDQKALGATASDAIPENAQFSNISDTPFISNKEFAKFNEKDKTSKACDNSKHGSHEEEAPDEPDGHVLGLPLPDIEDHADKISSIKKKILSSASKALPKLRGAPGMFIDLSDDVKPNREGVQSLVDRFMRHSAPCKTAEANAPVKVLQTEETANGLKVVEQILPYKPVVDNLNDKEMSKPGAKYLRLKNELIEKMAKKRRDEWKLKKEQGGNEDEGEDAEDASGGEAEEDLPDEEFEVTDSELEEDDARPTKKKKRKASAFVDEEAEVSGEEDEQDEEDEEDEEKEEDEQDEKMEVAEERDSDEEDTGDEKDEEAEEKDIVAEDDDTREGSLDTDVENSEKPKKPSRILRAFEEDSNSLPEATEVSKSNRRDKLLERTKTDVDIFAPEDGNDDWLSDTEVEIPPSQLPPRDHGDARSQLCKTPLTANILRFVSPITQLTALNGDSPRDSPASKITPLATLRLVESSVEKTPLEKNSPFSFNSEKKNGFQKKLFDDPAGTVNDDDLMDLCSGKFTCADEELQDKAAESRLSQLLEPETFRESTAQVLDEGSQDIRLTLGAGSDNSCDKLIGKESKDESKVPWTKLQVASSSEDEDCEDQAENKNRKKKLKKRKVKKLDLSDDEEVLSNEEEEDFEVLQNDEEDKYIDYDSEENEVVVVPKKDITKVAARFLDEEAELSESEWGSADEDEKDLDKLEFEEGDNEEIDEGEMRDQLEKIHMRQVLDEDRREVRMLQELLFDDGDLHTEGGGRERQFRWKNVDNLGDDDKLGERNNDVDENGDVVEEENDLEWRKERIEREKFIEEKMKSSEDTANDELEGDSQIFKLGMKALQKSKSLHTSQKDLDVDPMIKPRVPRSVLDLLGGPAMEPTSRKITKAVTRGSFLARGDEHLARLAVHIKQTEATITSRKNPRNFVFAHISPAIEGPLETDEKEEATADTDSLANTKAKKRKPQAGITPRTVKKPKIEVTRTTGKKLF